MTNTLIRPAWTPVTIAMMIIGFVIWWPLGLAMIAYIIWGDRLDELKSEVNVATDKAGEKMRSGAWGCSRRSHHRPSRGFSGSGNVAFDEWREAELIRLDEERRKLEEMRREFEEYSRELRRAKDKEEFDRFMNSHTSAKDVTDVAEEKPAKSKKKSGGGKSIPGV
ncbi:MAG: DUF2852 domain-containing protein [Pseudomonadota bacterium]